MLIATNRTIECPAEVVTPPLIATIVFALGILGLFWLDRDWKARTSTALWLPVVWLWILGSRELSKWLVVLGMRQAVVGSPSAELEGSPFDRALYSVLLMLGLIVLVGRGQRIGSLLKANAPIVLYFLYCAASVLWSDYPEVSLKRWIKAVTDLVMVMIVLTDADGLAAIKRLLTRTSFVLIPLSILVIKYYPDIGAFYSDDGRRFVTGITNDKNALGATCLLFGLGCVWRLLAAYRNREDPHRSQRLVAFGTLLAMVIWLFSKADSMTSLLTFVLVGSLMVATIISEQVRKRAVVNLLVATMLTVVALPLFFDTGTSLLRAVGRDATLTGRTEIWKGALAVDNNPILGAGFESFWLASPLDRWFSFHVNEAHNGYLEVYLNLGMVGLVLLAMIIVTGYRSVVGILRRDPTVGGVRLAYFVVGLIYSYSEAGFRMMGLVWIFFLLAGAVVPTLSIEQMSRARGSLAQRRRRLPLAATPFR